MDARKVTSLFAVAPQISPEDVQEAAEQGFKAIVNNRPDGEGFGQPSSAVIEAEAAKYGLEYRYVPVVSGRMTESDVAAFGQALDELDGPVLAYCRSGTRSVTLWALSQGRRMEPSMIIDAAAKAGYDLNGLEPSLRSRFEAARG